MRQKIDRDAAADVGQPGQLVPPEMLIQHHAMDEERPEGVSTLCVVIKVCWLLMTQPSGSAEASMNVVLASCPSALIARI